MQAQAEHSDAVHDYERALANGDARAARRAEARMSALLDEVEATTPRADEVAREAGAAACADLI